jgi:hypothetical protein
LKAEIGIGDTNLMDEIAGLSHKVGRTVIGIFERIKAKASSQGSFLIPAPDR